MCRDESRPDPSASRSTHRPLYSSDVVNYHQRDAVFPQKRPGSPVRDTLACADTARAEKQCEFVDFSALCERALARSLITRCGAKRHAIQLLRVHWSSRSRNAPARDRRNARASCFSATSNGRMRLYVRFSATSNGTMVLYGGESVGTFAAE